MMETPTTVIAIAMATLIPSCSRPNIQPLSHVNRGEAAMIGMTTIASACSSAEYMHTVANALTKPSSTNHHVPAEPRCRHIVFFCTRAMIRATMAETVKVARAPTIGLGKELSPNLPAMTPMARTNAAPIAKYTAIRIIDFGLTGCQQIKVTPSMVMRVPITIPVVRTSPRIIIANTAANSGEVESKVLEIVAPTLRLASNARNRLNTGCTKPATANAISP